MKEESEQQRGVTAQLQNQLAAFQRRVWNADDEIGQLKADQKLAIEILTTEYRARINEHYEGFRAQFQQVIDDRNAALGQALTRKSDAQSARYASALASVKAEHEKELGAVRNQLATDIEAARVHERNSGGCIRHQFAERLAAPVKNSAGRI